MNTKYSLEGYVFALFDALSFLIFCKCNNNQDCKFW